MKLKRDITSTAAPANNQIEVGELVINSRTGILYSKRTDGTIIKFLGAPVCAVEDNFVSPVPVPDISFSDVTNFCCGGDSLTVYVSNLLVNHRYSCSIIDLISGSSAVVLPTQSLNLLPLNKSDRSVVYNININRSTQLVWLFKVSINEIVNINNNDIQVLRSEKTLKICCTDCEV
jgi:hypothetical protein